MAADEALVFERYDLIAPTAGGFSVRFLFQRCRGKDYRVVVDEFVIAVDYRDRAPEEWAKEPPVSLLLGLGMAVLSHVYAAASIASMLHAHHHSCPRTQVDGMVHACGASACWTAQQDGAGLLERRVCGRIA